MSFLIKDEKLIENCNESWIKLSNIIKKEIDSKPVYNKKRNGYIYTNFHNKKIPKEGSQCIYLPVIFINSVYRKDKDIVIKILSSSVFRRM